MQRLSPEHQLGLLAKVGFRYELVWGVGVFRFVEHLVDSILRSLRTQGILDVAAGFFALLICLLLQLPGAG